MRQCTVIISFLSLLALAYAGPSGRIVGGTKAPDGAYPYQAFIKIIYRFQCGASILNKHWLLTAGHCVEDLIVEFTPTAVVVGTNDRLFDGVEYEVKSYIIHPDYKSGGGSAINDIALLYVSEEIQFNEKVKPIILPANDLENYEDDTAVLTGWGTEYFGGNSPQWLQHINSTIFNQKQCKDIWFEHNEIDILQSQICTFTKRHEGSCHGDSGGPLVVNGTQVGIVSFGWPCAMGYPDVYTRVSSFLNWINKYTAYESDEWMSKESIK